MELLSVKGRFFLCKLLHQCDRYLVGGYKKQLHGLQMGFACSGQWEYFLQCFKGSQVSEIRKFCTLQSG